VGAFAAEFSTAQLALRTGPDAARPEAYYGSFDTAHNDFLQLAAEQGVVGVLALLAAVAISVVGIRRRGGTSVGNRALAGGAVTTLAVVALGDFPFQLALTAFPALLFLAWLLAEEEVGASAR
jgi:O-antigen ligase